MIPFSFINLLEVVPFLRAIEERVSPDCTLYVLAAWRETASKGSRVSLRSFGKAFMTEKVMTKDVRKVKLIFNISLLILKNFYS